ncbi:MAG: acetyl-CoA carboxylase carboxyltransferase subunit alpha [Paracoccaceae bacterium]
MQHYLDFEKELAILDGRVNELRSANSSLNEEKFNNKEIAEIQKKSKLLLKKIYSDLTPWHKCQIARHPERPHSSKYIEKLMTEFVPLAGDKKFAEDKSIIGGLARLNDTPVVVIGHEKGNDTKSRIQHNFGMARPEGYRKAVRLMDLADRFNLPVITFIDTPGAYPGKGAEERGQAEAIASSIAKCLQIKVPLISIIIGEGGSGGAVALASSNKIIMLEHSIYSVISPEGCASILWKNSEKMKEAAESLRLTAVDLSKLGVVDEIISEPIGGAHRNMNETITKVGKAIERSLKKFNKFTPNQILNERRNKFLDVGKFKL